MNEDRNEDKQRDSKTDGDDAALWQRARAGLADGPSPEDAVDPMSIAAYLDGSLDEEAKEALERRLLGDPDGLELLIAARQGLDDGPAAHVPEAVQERAQGLVRAAPEDPLGMWHRFGAWLTGDGTASTAAIWAASAASFVLACVVGFVLGESSYESLATIATTLSQEAGLGLDPGAGPML